MKITDNLHNLHFKHHRMPYWSIDEKLRGESIYARQIFIVSDTAEVFVLFIDGQLYLYYEGFLEDMENTRIIKIPYIEKLPENYLTTIRLITILEVAILHIFNSLRNEDIKLIQTTEDLIYYFNQMDFSKDEIDYFTKDMIVPEITPFRKPWPNTKNSQSSPS